MPAIRETRSAVAERSGGRAVFELGDRPQEGERSSSGGLGGGSRLPNAGSGSIALEGRPRILHEHGSRGRTIGTRIWRLSQLVGGPSGRRWRQRMTW